MTIREREKLVAILKGEPMQSGRWAEALRDADHRALVEAVKECILLPTGVLVNRTKVSAMLDTLLKRVALLPPIELAEQKKGKEGQ